MTLCPHTHKQCVCQPSEGVMCEYGATPMTASITERLRNAIEELDETSLEQDALAEIERLERRCAALTYLLYGTPENPKSVEPGAPRCPRCNGPEGWHSMTCGRRLSIVAAEIRNDASAAILQNYAVPAQASEDWRLVHDWGPDCEYRWIRTCKCSRCAQNRGAKHE